MVVNGHARPVLALVLALGELSVPDGMFATPTRTDMRIVWVTASRVLRYRNVVSGSDGVIVRRGVLDAPWVATNAEGEQTILYLDEPDGSTKTDMSTVTRPK